ncbi:MAG: two-component sensor histidine kinase [Planctomycetes bacterium]|nr:two-component sensor histidine kinase [Planctomycetota bacterium]
MREPKGDDRLAQWGALAAGLAHEIKNPLSTMNISLQLMLEDLSDRQQIASARLVPRVEMLISEVQRLQRTLNEFLSLAREPDLELKERDPNALIEEIRVFIEPELSRQSIDLVTQVDRASRGLRVDPDLMRQALLNIIRNGMQAMEDGGTLTLQTRWSDDTFVIEVIDTGDGVADEIRDRIFDGFFGTRPGSTGIGLAITRQIIQLHGGDVTCESTVGVGTRFTVTLPVVGGEAGR